MTLLLLVTLAVLVTAIIASVVVMLYHGPH